jgi:TolA-binding protein
MVLLGQFRAAERVAGNQGSPALASSRASHDSAAATSGQSTVAEAQRPVTPAPASSMPESAEHSGKGSRRNEVLARLARVDPPTYLPRVLRGVADEATASFQAGMKAYVAGDYRGAIPQLRKASSLSPEKPDIAFYLAASELLSGDTAGAVTEFQRTIAMGETPFLEEAHFYLGKTYLSRSEFGAARTELEHVSQSGGETRQRAVELLGEMKNLGLR